MDTRVHTRYQHTGDGRHVFWLTSALPAQLLAVLRAGAPEMPITTHPTFGVLEVPVAYNEAIIKLLLARHGAAVFCQVCARGRCVTWDQIAMYHATHYVPPQREEPPPASRVPPPRQPPPPAAPRGLSRSEAARRLGLRASASEEDVRREFKQRILRAHPDHGGSDEAARRLVEARDRLLD